MCLRAALAFALTFGLALRWSVFAEFEPEQFVGSVLEQTQHYNRFANKAHQHYDPNWNDPNPVMDEYGFNCGVLLLNLTRMRARRWTESDYPLALATEARKKPNRAGVDGNPGEPVRGQGLRYFGFLAENDVWQYLPRAMRLCTAREHVTTGDICSSGFGLRFCCAFRLHG